MPLTAPLTGDKLGILVHPLLPEVEVGRREARLGARFKSLELYFDVMLLYLELVVAARAECEVPGHRSELRYLEVDHQRRAVHDQLALLRSKWLEKPPVAQAGMESHRLPSGVELVLCCPRSKLVVLSVHAELGLRCDNVHGDSGVSTKRQVREILGVSPMNRLVLALRKGEVRRLLPHFIG